MGSDLMGGIPAHIRAAPIVLDPVVRDDPYAVYGDLPITAVVKVGVEKELDEVLPPTAVVKRLSRDYEAVGMGIVCVETDEERLVGIAHVELRLVL